MREAGRVTVVTAPDGEPVDLETVKRHLKIEDLDTEDDLIQEVYIPSARSEAEIYLQRALLPQTLTLTLDRFPRAGPIEVPRPPLISITSIQYVDENEVTQTWSSSEYVADTLRAPGIVYPKYGYSYPSTLAYPNSVTITYQAGYADRASIPADIKRGILLLLSDAYELRENTLVLASSERLAVENSPRAAALLFPYRCHTFA